MRPRSDWVVLAVLAAISGVLVLVSSTRQGDALDHSSASDGFHGTSALRLLAADRGHPTSQLDMAFNPEPGRGVLFILSPTSRFSAAETQRLADYVSAGGIAVYGDERLDPRLAVQFGLRELTQPIPTTAHAATPVFANLHHVGDDTTSRSFAPGRNQAILLRHPEGPVLALESRIGSGRLIATTAPCLLCNGFLDRDDNALLAADLVALVPPGEPVIFDEYHHAAGGAGASDWNLTPFGIAIWWAVAILFLGLAIRGRAFGPRLPPPGARERSTSEYAAAVGHLLRQAGGTGLALRLATEATQRRLAERIGLRRDAPAAAFERVLEQRAPELASRYAEARREAGGAVLGESALLRAARRLHALAYPDSRAPK